MHEAKPWGLPLYPLARLNIFQSNGLRKMMSLDCISEIVFLFNDGQASCIPKQKEKDKYMEIGDKVFPLHLVNHCFMWLILGRIKHTVDKMNLFALGFTKPGL